MPHSPLNYTEGERFSPAAFVNLSADLLIQEHSSEILAFRKNHPAREGMGEERKIHIANDFDELPEELEEAFGMLNP